MFVRAIALGQDVVQGQQLGVILDIRGEVINEVCAPANGRIGGYHEHAGVEADARVVTLWLPTTPSVGDTA